MNNTKILTSEDVAWFRDGASLAAAARGAAAALARRIGLNAHRAAEVALAVTEAATNVHRHAVDGALLLRVIREDDGEAGVEFLTVDSGPGMTDVSAALADGASSAGTLGIGLGAVSRLADHFDLHSLPGRGTVMAAQFWPRSVDGRAVVASPGSSLAAGVTRPISGESVCGDAWAVRSVDTGGGKPVVLVMMCDGLGHGPLAARASSAAVKAFESTTESSPEGILNAVHRALQGTRGGAAAVARIEPEAGRVLYCGIGNVSGFLVGDDGRRALLSAPGIVGAQMRRLRTFEEPLPGYGALVMHSDGLTERWDPGKMPGLLHHSPLVTAGQLLREAAVRRDDASVVVVKGDW